MKLIKYATSHCPMCKAMEKQLELVTIPHETVMLYENDNESIAARFKIRSVPCTILFDDNDNEIARWQGVVKAEVINDKIVECENL